MDKNERQIKPIMCPVCREFVFSDVLSAEICPICGWNDDGFEDCPDEQSADYLFSFNDHIKWFKKQRELEQNSNGKMILKYIEKLFTLTTRSDYFHNAVAAHLELAFFMRNKSTPRTYMVIGLNKIVDYFLSMNDSCASTIGSIIGH